MSNTCEGRGERDRQAGEFLGGVARVLPARANPWSRLNMSIYISLGMSSGIWPARSLRGTTAEEVPLAATPQQFNRKYKGLGYSVSAWQIVDNKNHASTGCPGA